MYSCKECQTILFKEEWKRETKELEFNQIENVEFIETTKLGLPIIQINCKQCHNSIGYVKQNPIIYIPYYHSIVIINNQKNKQIEKEIKEVKENDDVDKKEIEIENEIQEEEKEKKSLGKTIKSIVYFGLIHLPIVAAFFSN